jgi:hypothetical protein
MKDDDETQELFNKRMYKIVSDTICQCYFEARGIWPAKPPPESAVRETILATIHFGVPQTERDVCAMVRRICHHIGFNKIGLN